MELQYTPVADFALLVTFGEQIDDSVHHAIVALDKAITRSTPEGFIETVPAMVNLLVTFDPLVTDASVMEREIRGRASDLELEQSPGSVRTVNVCYEEPFGPDLDAIANATGLDRETVINTHLNGDYKVMMYGFAPGYAYMAGVESAIQVPRKKQALRDIAAGSVLIAGPQCLVTTLIMPTGWSIIGRSPTQILQSDSDDPFLFDVGDQVCFERIDLATYEQLARTTD